MKAACWGSVFIAAILAAPILVADMNALKGTWSGNWTPKGGVPDSITLELKLDANGKLSGKFLTPVPMDFSKASFNSKTAMVLLEAGDPQSGKHYKVEGKVEGTEIKGTFENNGVTGEVRLIKWTYFGR